MEFLNLQTIFMLFNHNLYSNNSPHCAALQTIANSLSSNLKNILKKKLNNNFSSLLDLLTESLRLTHSHTFAICVCVRVCECVWSIESKREK